MYANHNIKNMLRLAEATIEYPIEKGRTGVSVYIDCNPDDVSPDIYIDPADEKGIEIFREFAAKMAAHYKSLNDKP